MKEFDHEIKKHLTASMSKIEDDFFTPKIVARHLSFKKEKEAKSYFNFGALLFWIISILISIALLIMSSNVEIEFFEIQIKHCLILISLTLTGLVYKWLEKNYQA